jgi:hypothetical protein
MANVLRLSFHFDECGLSQAQGNFKGVYLALNGVTQGGPAYHIYLYLRDKTQIQQALTGGPLGMVAADAGPISRLQVGKSATSSFAVLASMERHVVLHLM